MNGKQGSGGSFPNPLFTVLSLLERMDDSLDELRVLLLEFSIIHLHLTSEEG